MEGNDIKSLMHLEKDRAVELCGTQRNRNNKRDFRRNPLSVENQQTALYHFTTLEREENGVNFFDKIKYFFPLKNRFSNAEKLVTSQFCNNDQIN